MQFKVLAIKPLLEQLLDAVTYDGIMSNDAPFHEYSAVSKFVVWVQQVSCEVI